MAMVINTNVGSLNATRQLDSSSRDLATSMERLTSGKRINSAADDAAGLAVATKMTSQIMGTDQAVVMLMTVSQWHKPLMVHQKRWSA